MMFETSRVLLEEVIKLSDLSIQYHGFNGKEPEKIDELAVKLEALYSLDDLELQVGICSPDDSFLYNTNFYRLETKALKNAGTKEVLDLVSGVLEAKSRYDELVRDLKDQKIVVHLLYTRDAYLSYVTDRKND